jgi:hypothetical protein
MQKFDLLLLEDMMMRAPVETTATAKICQTACMLLVLATVLAVFAHALAHRDATIAQASRVTPATLELSVSVPGVVMP